MRVEEWDDNWYSQLRRVKGEVTAKRIARNHSGGRRWGRKRKGVVAKEMKFFRGDRIRIVGAIYFVQPCEMEGKGG